MAMQTVTLMLDADLVAGAMQYTDDLSAFVNRALEAALHRARTEDWASRHVDETLARLTRARPGSAI